MTAIIEKNSFSGLESIQDEIGQRLQNEALVRSPEYKPGVVKRRKRRNASVDLRYQKFG